MIKLIQCVKRRPDIALTEFRREWAAYRQTLLDLAPQVGAVKVALSTTLAVEANLELMTVRGTRDPYDGVAQIWWHNATEVLAALARPGVEEQVAAMQRRQAEFIDLESSTFFFAVEDEAIDPIADG